MYVPRSALNSAKRAWSKICALRQVQRICCAFSISQRQLGHGAFDELIIANAG